MCGGRSGCGRAGAGRGRRRHGHRRLVVGGRRRGAAAGGSGKGGEDGREQPSGRHRAMADHGYRAYQASARSLTAKRGPMPSRIERPVRAVAGFPVFFAHTRRGPGVAYARRRHEGYFRRCSAACSGTRTVTLSFGRLPGAYGRPSSAIVAGSRRRHLRCALLTA